MIYSEKSFVDFTLGNRRLRKIMFSDCQFTGGGGAGMPVSPPMSFLGKEGTPVSVLGPFQAEGAVRYP